MNTQRLIETYYAAFNAGDVAGMLACVADDVRHEVNQGEVRTGKAAFGAFCTEMNSHYRERLTDIAIMVAPGGARAAAEFWVNGAYLKTSAGSPPARGQHYKLRAGTFFEIANGKIARVTTYYNAADWLRQVSAGGEITVRALKGPELRAALPVLAQLRITVFRDYPYLYEGDLSYEKKYLDVYAKSEGAIIVAALDGDKIVGAATAAPMEDHAAAFAKAFEERGYNAEEILYCGESVLLPEYRGGGLGHKFFDVREAHGRALGRTLSAFCGVVRPTDHPMCPSDYRPLDAFWEKRGYRKLEGFTANLSWPDIGEPGPTVPVELLRRAPIHVLDGGDDQHPGPRFAHQLCRPPSLVDRLIDAPFVEDERNEPADQRQAVTGQKCGQRVRVGGQEPRRAELRAAQAQLCHLAQHGLWHGHRTPARHLARSPRDWRARQPLVDRARGVP